MCFSAVRTANAAEKTVSHNFNIKIHHGMMIQSRMPTRWSCKPNQCAYESSKQDLEKSLGAFQLTGPRFPLRGPFKCLIVGHSRGLRLHKSAECLRQDKRAQRLTFRSGDRPVGWGSSTRRGGGRKVHALPRKFVFLGF